jgi:RNA methyltransferase, TrmH family
MVDVEIVAALSQTVHPQGVVARCGFVDVPLPTLLEGRPRLLAVCADIRDPGNAGSVLRCADAAGAEGVVFVGDSVDPYNPKAVRASVGSLFHVGVAVEPDAAAPIAEIRSAGLRVLAADGSADLDLDTAADQGLLADPTAWLFGNEAWGLPEHVRDLADVAVRVPIHGRAESLNLAAAAAVCLYASARAQRGRG